MEKRIKSHHLLLLLNSWTSDIEHWNFIQTLKSMPRFLCLKKRKIYLYFEALTQAKVQAAMMITDFLYNCITLSSPISFLLHTFSYNPDSNFNSFIWFYALSALFYTHKSAKSHCSIGLDVTKACSMKWIN